MVDFFLGNRFDLAHFKINFFFFIQDLVHQRRVRILEREHERQTIQPAKSRMRKFFSFISEPTVYKPFCILTMCFFFQQMSGIYIFIFYTVEFFKVSKPMLNMPVSLQCCQILSILASRIEAPAVPDLPVSYTHLTLPTIYSV